MSTKFYSLQVSEIRRETPGCVSVAFSVPSSMANDFTFEAGQYLTIKKTIQNQELRRSYSLCSAPHENEWRVAIKQIPDGVFSGYANKELQEGDTLEVLAPMGNFKFTPAAQAQKNYLLIAAGSGVTPIFSILKTNDKKLSLEHTQTHTQIQIRTYMNTLSSSLSLSHTHTIPFLF